MTMIKETTHWDAVQDLKTTVLFLSIHLSSYKKNLFRFKHQNAKLCYFNCLWSYVPQWSFWEFVENAWSRHLLSSSTDCGLSEPPSVLPSWWPWPCNKNHNISYQPLQTFNSKLLCNFVEWRPHRFDLISNSVEKHRKSLYLDGQMYLTNLLIPNKVYGFKDTPYGDTACTYIC